MQITLSPRNPKQAQAEAEQQAEEKRLEEEAPSNSNKILEFKPAIF